MALSVSHCELALTFSRWVSLLVMRASLVLRPSLISKSGCAASMALSFSRLHIFDVILWYIFCFGLWLFSLFLTWRIPIVVAGCLSLCWCWSLFNLLYLLVAVCHTLLFCQLLYGLLFVLTAKSIILSLCMGHHWVHISFVLASGQLGLRTFLFFSQRCVVGGVSRCRFGQFSIRSVGHQSWPGMWRLVHWGAHVSTHPKFPNSVWCFLVPWLQFCCLRGLVPYQFYLLWCWSLRELFPGGSGISLFLQRRLHSRRVLVQLCLLVRICLVVRSHKLLTILFWASRLDLSVVHGRRALSGLEVSCWLWTLLLLSL